ncbi:MAG: YecA family protein [Bdellovibrionales bacterium]
MKSLLAEYHPNLSFAEVRAATAGAVLTVENVQPSQLFEHLFGGEDARPAFEDLGAAQAWYSCLMGLWNELASHQELDNPFLFSDWPTEFPGGNEGLLRAAIAREKEIEQFLWGLRAGNTPFADDFVDPTPEALMSWTPTVLEAALRVMKRTRQELEKGKSKDWIMLAASHFALNDQLKEHHGEFVTGIRDLRSQWIEDIKQSATVVRAEPKVGRNDPCPCGSGKKFKQCCLQ